MDANLDPREGFPVYEPTADDWAEYEAYLSESEYESYLEDEHDCY